MREESGFFSPEDFDSRPDVNDGQFHDFRLLYYSARGFTRVFLAKKQGRNFIVKTLREEFRNDAAARAALRKEYDSGFPVDSRFVARTIDLTALPDYGPALITEYCSGQTLAEIIDTGAALDDSDIGRIVNGLATALDDIHSAGIIHRDIKPQNVIYSRPTRSLKVIDFGCADAERFYLLHGAAGTERYTPPVSDSAGANGADLHNDFYAAGMTLSELALAAPRSCVRALEATASAMIARRLSDGHSVAAFYRSELARRRRRWILPLVPVVLAVAVAVSLMVLHYGRQPEEKMIEPLPHATVDSVKPRMSLSADTAPVAVALVVSGPVREKVTDRVDEDTVVCFGNRSELVKNEFGVSHAEAKYLANFSKNKFDRFIVESTDKQMTSFTILINSSSAGEEERAGAAAGYNSLDTVVGKVMAEAARYFSEGFDRRRARGLIKERHAFWLEGYRPPLLELHYGKSPQ